MSESTKDSFVRTRSARAKHEAKRPAIFAVDTAIAAL